VDVANQRALHGPQPFNNSDGSSNWAGRASSRALRAWQRSVRKTVPTRALLYARKDVGSLGLWPKAVKPNEAGGPRPSIRHNRRGRRNAVTSSPAGAPRDLIATLHFCQTVSLPKASIFAP
jgi:hypothetical protein